MGLEAVCRATFQGNTVDVKVHLDTSAVQTRGTLRLDVPFAEIKHVSADDGVLRIEWDRSELKLQLGPAAGKWAEKIRNPPTLLSKLGVKSGQSIGLLNWTDPAFVTELRNAGADCSERAHPEADIVFLAVNGGEDLDYLGTVKMQPAGAVWVIWPKGQKHLNENHVRAAAAANGLTDVKVVRFSETHSALKLVIPLARRK